MAGTVERTLALKLIGDIGSLSKGLGQVDRRLGKTAKAAVSWGKALGGALIIGGLERLAYASIDGVKAFREEQDAVRNFNKTVRNIGVPVKRATKDLDRMAERAVSLGFDDGDTIKGMDMFLQQAGNIGRASQMMGLAFDIARSRQIPLTDAIKVAQNVYKGSSRELDKYGISGVKGMAAVNRAREIERGKAAKWARNHPAEVLLGKISDSWADVVGNLSQGRFGEALKAGQKLARQLTRGIFGWTDKEGKRHAGLFDRLFDASEGKDGKPKGIINKLGQDIADELGKVDWGKGLSDALTTGLNGLKEGIDSGSFAQIGAIGGAIAGAMFLGSLFIDAAKAVFGLPGFLAKGAVSVAGAAAGGTIGLAISAAMFLASMFVDAAALTMGTLSKDKIVLGAARGLGGSIGGSVISGIVLGLTGVLAVAAVANALSDLFTSAESDWTKRSGLPDSPFKWPWSEGGFFFPNNAKGTSNWRGGPTWVGEEGPELLNVPRGSQIMPHRQSMAMAGGGTTINLTVNGYVGSEDQLGRVINRALAAYVQRGGRLGYR